MDESDNIQIIHQTIGATAAKAALNIGGLVGTIVFARVLGPTSFGGFSLLMTLSTFVDRPMYGWAEANKKRLSESNNNISQFVGSVLSFNIVWICIIGISSSVLSKYIISYTDIENSVGLLILIISSLSFFTVLTPLLEAQGQVSMSNWINTLRSYIKIPLQIAFVMAGLGVSGMVMGSATGAIFVIPITLYYINGTPSLPNMDLLKHCWAYARYSIPAIALKTVTKRIDIFILGTILAPTAVGYYEVAWRFTVPSMFLAQAAGSGLMAKVSALSKKNIDVSGEISDTLSFVSLISIPLFFGSLTIGSDLMSVAFGKEYTAATPLLIGLAAYCVIQSQSEPLVEVVNGLDRPDLDMRFSILTFTVNVVLGIILVFMIGRIGVVVATIIAELIRYVLALAFISRKFSITQIYSKDIFEQLGSGCIMALSIILLDVIFQPVGLTKVVSMIVFGAMIYFGILTILNPKYLYTATKYMKI